MRHSITAILLLLAVSTGTRAQRVTADKQSFGRLGDNLVVEAQLGLDSIKVTSNRAVFITPVINAPGRDSLALPTSGIYGRSRWWYYMRTGRLDTLETSLQYRAGDRPDTLNYRQVIPWQDWMEDSHLLIYVNEYTCAGCEESSLRLDLGSPETPWMLTPWYVVPEVEQVKQRQLEGRANVEFIVDKWDIVETYRDNYREYAKIRASIDTVRSDPDSRITAIQLTGYASPESPYSHNTMLSHNRVEAIKRYVLNLYPIDPDMITTAYIPEDWQGLRDFVEGSNLRDREAILALIDSDEEPDRKEYLIKSRYPEDFKFLYETIYPALRHTDYRISYVISNFTDPARCLELVLSAPQKLSLSEFYLAAQECEKGSELFCEVFETAVRMYPDSDVANLNAATAEMGRGDTAGAARHLSKAGDTPAALFARGSLAAMEGRLDEAAALWTQVSDTTTDPQLAAAARQCLDKLKKLNIEQ